MKQIIQIVQLDMKKSILLAKALNPKIIVVKAQELLTKATTLPNGLFKKIRDVGGIHNYLNYNGKVILSFVMRDDMLEKINIPIYCDMIDFLKPDFYTTPDCESYEGECSFSEKQIAGSLIKTIELLKLCPQCKPIGQVKGCSREQVLAHYNILKQLGINIFILHTTDFFRYGDENKIQVAKQYARLIKNKGNLLFLYGFGTQNRLEEFSFVDGYMTYSHFTNAYRGFIFEGRKKKVYPSSITSFHAVVHNWREMVSNLQSSNIQTKLFEGGGKWEEEVGLLEVIQERH